MDLDRIDPRSTDVAHCVTNLSFRFYSDTEALRLSVRRLTSPHAFDELGRPISRGLYDPALGPVSYEDGPCPTCGLDYNTCPGHFGHIELPVPVPNPLLMKVIIKIMRASCWTCPCLRTPESDLNLHLTRLYFEDADMPTCGFAVEAFRTLRKRKFTRTEADIASGDAEQLKGIVVSNWKGFLQSLPEPLSKYTRNVGSNNVELIERNMLEAARVTWKRVRAAGGLAKQRSAGWNETVDQIFSTTTIQCPACFRKPLKTRVGTRGRLFRKEAHGEMLFAASEIEAHISALWKQHEELFDLLFGLKGRELSEENDTERHQRLFVQTVLVPPSRFRPTSVVGEMDYAAEHPQNLFFQRLLTEVEVIMKANEYGLAEDYRADSEDGADADKPIVDRPTKARFAQAMTNMQEALKDLYDSSGNMGGRSTQMTGIRQQLEAKAGLFRQHMMGKRVNYSCRSVIGPDVFLDTDEIGIPESFAKLLTVPEPVTPANLSQMQQAVMNGPDVYPGAVAVEDWTSSGEHRIVKFSTSKLKSLLSVQAGLLLQNRIPNGSEKQKSHEETQASADDIAVDSFHNGAGSVPKRVHRHLKTGDIVLFNRQPTLHRVSIMAHKVKVLPGDRTIRFHYANCNSYNADFDGDEMNVHIPQDYLARAEAEELMLSSKHYIVPTSGAPVRGLIQDHIAAATLLSQRDAFLPLHEFMQLLYSATEKLMSRPGKLGRKYVLPVPAVLKPRRLWTGKQLISAVLFVVRDGRPGLNLEAGTKTKSNIIGGEESQVIFREGELLRGVIDKSALGSSMYGIVHAVQESYGCAASDDFLSAMSRLCVFYLRNHGHTTGVDDLVLQAHGERKRIKILQGCAEEVGVSVTNSVYTQMSKGDKNRLPDAKTLVQARLLVEEMIRRDGREAEDRLDTAMKSALNKVSSDVMKNCVPVALKKSFPKNGFALMTNTGAKGSAVNAAQISCLLGSTVLEGRRVPRMGGSGSTLPCFAPYDASPMAGGFIASRFLTGISPQEFFFHAMSGREGLLDTSLKTANSGYLQRCLIKHMEGVRLHYDFTVRDSDNSVLQFIYGDDGIDPSKSRWLNEKIDWQVSNERCLRRDFHRDGDSRHVQSNKLHKERSGTVMEDLSPAALSKRGAISKSFNEAVEKVESEGKQARNFNVRKFLEARYQESALQPGEAVGIVAAQGIGEPSTQMTLNTFHHAGSSSAHVTLGIPRLRELLMTAAKYPKTPSMTLPIKGTNAEEDAKRLVRRLQSMTLSDLLVQVEAREVGIAPLSGMVVRNLKIVLTFPPEEVYAEELGFGFEDILHFVGDWFLTDFHKLLRRDISRVGAESGIRQDPGTSMYLKVAQKPEYLSAMPRIPSEATDEPSDREQEQTEHGAGEDTEVDEQSDLNDASSSDEGENDEDEDEMGDEERDSRRRQKDLIEKQVMDEAVEGEDDMVKSKKKHKSVRKKKRPNPEPVQSTQDDGNDDTSSLFGMLGYMPDSLVTHSQDCIEFRWAMPATVFGKLDIASVARESASRIKLAHVDRISRCFIDKTANAVQVITEGSNIEQIIEKGQDLIDLDHLETNDMYGILERYGVEAMRTALIQEFGKVFDAYGIPVNIRHLRLIADYMTAHGGYRGFNRHAMHSTPSPFQRMTFETSVTFLTDSALNATCDEMKNPSAALALGQVYEGGTGGFELLQTVGQ